ncbi:MAG: hypothetical protein ACU837_11875 [Gammaproteobacteria bacterium]
MKRITISEGIAVAVALTAINVAALFMLQLTFAWPTALKADIAVLALLYLAYLFYRGGSRTGKFILGAGCIAFFATAMVFIDTYAAMFAAAVTLVAAMRSLLYAGGLLSALAHLTLCLLGAAFAGYVAIAGNGATAAAWCFFLTQSLWALLPGRKDSLSPAAQCAADANRFNRAYRMAETAIEKWVKNAPSS